MIIILPLTHPDTRGHSTTMWTKFYSNFYWYIIHSLIIDNHTSCLWLIWHKENVLNMCKFWDKKEMSCCKKASSIKAVNKKQETESTWDSPRRMEGFQNISYNLKESQIPITPGLSGVWDQNRVNIALYIVFWSVQARPGVLF